VAWKVAESVGLTVKPGAPVVGFIVLVEEATAWICAGVPVEEATPGLSALDVTSSLLSKRETLVVEDVLGVGTVVGVVGVCVVDLTGGMNAGWIVVVG